MILIFQFTEFLNFSLSIQIIITIANNRYRNEDVKQPWYNSIWTSITRQFVGVGLNLMSKYVFVSGNKKEFCVSFDINLKKERPHTFSALLGSLWQLLLKRELPFFQALSTIYSKDTSLFFFSLMRNNNSLTFQTIEKLIHHANTFIKCHTSVKFNLKIRTR